MPSLRVGLLRFGVYCTTAKRGLLTSGCCTTTALGLLTSLPAAPSPTCLPQALPAGATPSQPRKWKPFRSILENDNNG